MIIVEGPDGAGKTTLITKLSHILDLPVAPRVVSKDTEAMIDLKAWTEQNVAQGWQATIFDRHRLISEPIYGSLLRVAFQPGFDDFNWLYNMNYMLYHRVQPVVIYCLPPYETVRVNIKDDSDNKRVADAIRKIYSMYVCKAASDAAMFQALHYDYTKGEMVDSLVEWLRHSLSAKSGRIGHVR